MGSALLITLRESLEAALVIGLMLGYLVRVGKSRLIRAVWWGTGAAVAGSILTAYLFERLAGGFEGRGEQIFEGLMMLAAVILLTTMILWMQRQARGLRRRIEERLARTAATGESLGIGSLAFLAVFREGVETTVFIQTALFSATGQEVLLGAVIGLVVATVLALLTYRGAVRLDLRSFFLWTGALLILFAAGLLAHGVHELEEAGFLPPLVEHLWDINGRLNEKGAVGSFLKALFGYNGDPSLTEAVSWLIYLLTTARLYFGRSRLGQPEGDELVASYDTERRRKRDAVSS